MHEHIAIFVAWLVATFTIAALPAVLHLNGWLP